MPCGLHWTARGRPYSWLRLLFLGFRAKLADLEHGRHPELGLGRRDVLLRLFHRAAASVQTDGHGYGLVGVVLYLDTARGADRQLRSARWRPNAWFLGGRALYARSHVGDVEHRLLAKLCDGFSFYFRQGRVAELFAARLRDHVSCGVSLGECLLLANVLFRSTVAIDYLISELNIGTLMYKTVSGAFPDKRCLRYLSHT